MKNFSNIMIQGDAATDFLQGQLTCDVAKLTPHQATAGAYCDIKGRMLANFWCIRLSDKAFVLWLHESLADTVVATLKKYAVFSKVDIALNTDWQSTVITCPTENNAEDSIIAPLPGKQHWLYLSKCTAEPAIDHNTFALYNIAARCVFLQDKTSLQFTPQMIGWERFNGVSFNKGCYLGQEIVARTQHLGKLKRHCQLLSSNSTVNIGDDVSLETGEVVGKVCEVAATPQHYQLLAVLQDRALDQPLFTHNTTLTLATI